MNRRGCVIQRGGGRPGQRARQGDIWSRSHTRCQVACWTGKFKCLSWLRFQVGCCTVLSPQRMSVDRAPGSGHLHPRRWRSGPALVRRWRHVRRSSGYHRLPMASGRHPGPESACPGRVVMSSAVGAFCCGLAPLPQAELAGAARMNFTRRPPRLPNQCSTLMRRASALNAAGRGGGKLGRGQRLSRASQIWWRVLAGGRR